MNWPDFVNADGDAILFGYTDILLFDIQMLEVHCDCTCFFLLIKICVGYFLSNFYFFAKCDSLSKTIKNVFYLIEKALFALEIFNFSPSLK